jgi:hypothetical protein
MDPEEGAIRLMTQNSLSPEISRKTESDSGHIPPMDRRNNRDHEKRDLKNTKTDQKPLRS